jgi:hypothetical protein
MNSVVPNTYSSGGTTQTPITFTCTGVPDGTYTSANDANLMVEPYATSWEDNVNGNVFTAYSSGTSYSSGSVVGYSSAPYRSIVNSNVNSQPDISPSSWTLVTSEADYLRYDTWTKVRGYITASNPGRALWTFPQIGTAGCQSTYGWANATSGMADYATKYYTGFASAYLSAQSSIGALLGQRNAPSLGIGDRARTFYGCYSQYAPLLNQNSSVSVNFGYEAPISSVTQFSGNTLTLASPHNISNIVPGITRVTLSGMSNAADNGNYYILTTPTANSMTVANSTPDFVGVATTATLTFQNGDTMCASGCTITATPTISAVQTLSCGTAGGFGQGSICSGTFGYSGSPNSSVNMHRGQTFTLSGAGGSGGSSFNSRIFSYSTENVVAPKATFGNHYREIPQGNSSSGTAMIIPDNNAVVGRNGTTISIQDPDMGFSGQVYGLLLRGAGTRLYAGYSNLQGYSYQGGYLNSSNGTIFNDTTLQNQQLYVHPHWENVSSVPNFHAIGLANLLNERIAPYLLTSSLPSPDYGSRFECVARTGASGDMMACLNMTNTTQSSTFTFTNYLVAGQSIVQFLANSQAITLKTYPPATANANVSVPKGGEVVFLFPNNFASELLQPTISFSTSSVANTASVAVRYGYDKYLLDIGDSVVNCGVGPTCTLPVDKKMGPVYYRLFDVNSSSNVIATSDVQQL